jgi:hypothetical protein
MLNNLKNILIIILLIIITILLILSNDSGKDSSNTLIIHDTAIITRYEKEVKRDTIIKWFKKIKYLRNTPSEIHYQKSDSNMIKDLKAKDLIFKIDKKNDELIIKALNQKDEKIKEYRFDDAVRDFTLVSQNDNIFLKSKNYYFDGIKVGLGYSFYKERKFNVNVTTGINWRESLYLKALASYDLNSKTLNAGVSLGIKLIK